MRDWGILQRNNFTSLAADVLPGRLRQICNFLSHVPGWDSSSKFMVCSAPGLCTHRPVPPFRVQKNNLAEVIRSKPCRPGGPIRVSCPKAEGQPTTDCWSRLPLRYSQLAPKHKHTTSFKKSIDS